MRLVSMWEERRPYLFSFFLALSTALLALFYHSDEFDAGDFGIYQPIQFVNVEAKPKATKESEISTEEGEEAQEDAEIAALEAVAVDLAFYPDIDMPKRIVAFKNNFPRLAREEGVEATIYYSLLIDEKGQVRKIYVDGIVLSKEVPPELKKRLISDFHKAGIENMQKARFTPTVVEGEKTPVLIGFPLTYSLSDM